MIDVKERVNSQLSNVKKLVSNLKEFFANKSETKDKVKHNKYKNK